MKYLNPNHNATLIKNHSKKANGIEKTALSNSASASISHEQGIENDSKKTIITEKRPVTPGPGQLNLFSTIRAEDGAEDGDEEEEIHQSTAEIAKIFKPQPVCFSLDITQKIKPIPKKHNPLTIVHPISTNDTKLSVREMNIQETSEFLKRTSTTLTRK